MTHRKDLRDIVSRIRANLERGMEKRETNALALAREAGLNDSTIYDILYERSKNPQIMTLVKIAEALKVPLSEMFMTPEEVQAHTEIIRMFDRLSPDDQRMFSRFVETWTTSERE